MMAAMPLPVAAAAEFPLTYACWQRCLNCLLPKDERREGPDNNNNNNNNNSIMMYEKYIAARYTEPQRHYHTLSHLEEMLQHFMDYQAAAHIKKENGMKKNEVLVVELAVLFHDAVYDPQKGDNEDRSAEWFRSFWGECREMSTGATRRSSDPLVWDELNTAMYVEEEVVNFILQTKSHMSVEPFYAPGASSSQSCTGGTSSSAPPPMHVFLDLDLAILGSEPGRYMQYARDVRREYGWYSEEEFCRGRAAVLRGFMKHAQWYKTQFFFEALERRARANVEAEMAALEAQLESG